mmetsp:Transcript_33359/g.95550  ORF Transcript_33359/g.95550 Transcript_33359/m.95550 type:complete len:299 (-) Transcript_33359:203-1099(-)
MLQRAAEQPALGPFAAEPLCPGEGEGSAAQVPGPERAPRRTKAALSCDEVERSRGAPCCGDKCVLALRVARPARGRGQLHLRGPGTQVCDPTGLVRPHNGPAPRGLCAQGREGERVRGKRYGQNRAGRSHREALRLRPGPQQQLVLVALGLAAGEQQRRVLEPGHREHTLLVAAQRRGAPAPRAVKDQHVRLPGPRRRGLARSQIAAAGGEANAAQRPGPRTAAQLLRAVAVALDHAAAREAGHGTAGGRHEASLRRKHLRPDREGWCCRARQRALPRLLRSPARLLGAAPAGRQPGR